MKKFAAYFMFVFATLLADEHLAPAARMRGDARVCAVCDKPLVRAEGFAPCPELRVHPDDTVALVIGVDGGSFPNRRPWMLLAKPQRDWDVPIAFEFCESCDARFEARVREVKSNAKLREELLRRLEARAHSENWPNQTPEPTPTSVTPPAGAGLAPAALVAHL